MAEQLEYERLLQATSLIARHPDCPEKQDVVLLCRAEIDERCRTGALSIAQRSRLLDILEPASYERRPNREPHPD